MRMGIMGYNQGKSPSTAPNRVVRLRDPTKHDCTHMILYMQGRRRRGARARAR
jgi:hypothetical protein